MSWPNILLVGGSELIPRYLTSYHASYCAMGERIEKGREKNNWREREREREIERERERERDKVSKKHIECEYIGSKE